MVMRDMGRQDAADMYSRRAQAIGGGN
jgi:hypothetical protein